MYERFTDRARKVMQLANRRAVALNHEHIDTEHILLGLLDEGTGVGMNVLKNLRVDVAGIRSKLESLLGAGAATERKGRLSQTQLPKRVIANARQEARGLHHNYVGTEHLLLGLVRVKEGVAGVVLAEFGLREDQVRDEIVELLGHQRTKHARTQAIGCFLVVLILAVWLVIAILNR